MQKIPLFRDHNPLARSARRKYYIRKDPYGFTGIPGEYVKIEDTVRGFKGLVEGEYDDLPEQAFYMVGKIEQAIEKAKGMST